MHPPLDFCAHFRTCRVCGHLHHRLFLCPTVPPLGRKGHSMKLKVRYDESVQTIDLDAKAMEELWVSLSLDGEGLAQGEKEQMIQDAFDVQYNRPDYNCWHKFWRHHGESKAKPGDEEDEADTSEPLMSEVADDRIFRKDELAREEREGYETVCQFVREACGRKTDWAEMFIAVRIGGMSVNDYAAQVDANPSNISPQLDRAAHKIEKFLGNRQI